MFGEIFKAYRGGKNFFFSNNPGHRINVTAMPIYGKIFIKYSFPEPMNLWP